MKNEPIFVASDILTTTTPEMWEAMMGAKLSWAKNGKDENIARFTRRICELTGQEDAIIVSTGGAANLAALLTHARPGEQIVTDRNEHILWQEGDGVFSVAGLRVAAIDAEHGIMTAAEVARAADYSVCNQHPRNAAVFLENTHTIGGGLAYTPEGTAAIAAVARERGMALHIDGARLWNAAACQSTPVADLTRLADSVSISLNKILGVPFGAVLCGSAEFIRSATDNMRRISAFSMHKAGMIAAAAMTRLSEAHFPIFMDDIVRIHALTKTLASRLNDVPGIRVDVSRVQSNLFFMDVSGTGIDAADFIQRMEAKGVVTSYRSRELVRFVLSTNITEKHLETVVQAVGASAA